MILRRAFYPQAAFYSLLAMIVVLPFSSALAEIFSVSLLISWGILFFGNRDYVFFKITPKPVWIFLAVSTAWMFLTSALGDHPAQSLSAAATKWGECALLFMATTETLSSDRRRLKTFLMVLILSSLLIAGDGIWQMIAGWDFLRAKKLAASIYPTASFAHHTFFGAYLALVLVVGVGANLRTGIPKKERLLLIFHHGLTFIALILTFSRGAWLGAVIGLAGLFWMKDKRLLILVVLSIAVLLIFSPVNLTFRFREFTSGSWGGYRPELWAAGWRLILDHPWLGIGINQFAGVIPNYGFSYGPAYAHNSFLQYAAETGIPGLFLFLGFLISGLTGALFRIKKVALPEQGIVCALVFALAGFLAQGFFNNVLYNINLALLFWILLGSLNAWAHGKHQ